MKVLCGRAPVAEALQSNGYSFIKNRSVSLQENQRDLAVKYLQNLTSSLGFSSEVQIQKKTTYPGGKATDFNLVNLIVTIPGEGEGKDEGERIVIGAHYDVQNSLSGCWLGTKTEGFLVTEGADDNTSGVVGCLLFLWRWKKLNLKSKRTIQVVFFDGEEPGALLKSLAIGSGYYVDSLSDDEVKKTKLAIVLDMIGAPPTDPSVGLVLSLSEDLPFWDLDSHLKKNVKNEIKFTLSSPKENEDLSCLNLTDSRPFVVLGIPAVLINNCAGYHDVPDFYHTERDTIEVIDWPTFFLGVDLLFSLVELYAPKK
eukprot:TRINITY_DN3914_c0_g1_i2.p1 TRINITY_DN3914_c0_g1~~TRINITY_DN3914_c0_g1_i2.p1  ORF type:complete len:346 (+),score=112.49 TRINITY_DN3914_c0_g1_i2:103-1038(+)